MRKLMVFQHVPFEPLGTLDGQFRSAGFRIRYVNFGRMPDARPQVDRYHGLVVLGGPMSVHQTARYPHLGFEREAIRRAAERGIPILGVCLGAQLIADAMGARVIRNPVKEIGWYEVSATQDGAKDPLFKHFNGVEKIFQWHSDTFTMPSGAVHLAASPTCANQAFRFGESVYGLQFHLEADQALIKRWLTTPVHRKELLQLSDAVDPQLILHETARYIHRAEALSRAVFGEFIQRFFGWRRRIMLPSR